MSNFLTLNSVSKLIKALGTTNTFLVEGQPGIGKSAILKQLNLPQFRLDCARLQDSADVLFPFVDTENQSIKFKLVGMLSGLMKHIEKGEPVAIMVDELGKAPRIAMNALITLFVDRYIDEYSLPEGSVVFATTNLATDGVGDNIPSHVYNRLTAIKCKGPSYEDWMHHAMQHEIDPILITWAHEYPYAFDTYADKTVTISSEENEFNFNPRHGDRAKHFCSPRSLFAASPIVKGREAFTNTEFEAALAGTVGAAAAASIVTFTNYSDQIPSIKEVIEKGSKLKPLEGIHSVMGAVLYASKSTRENVNKIVAYLDRCESAEPVTLYAQFLIRQPTTSQLVVNKRLQEIITDFCNSGYYEMQGLSAAPKV